MRKITTILLLNLMLVPLIWNGVSIIHYLVEHTHTLCGSERDHQHTSTKDCHTICQIAPQHDQGQIPHKLEFYKLKQCISSLSYFDVQLFSPDQTSISPDYSLLYKKIISKDIFRPPIA